MISLSLSRRDCYFLFVFFFFFFSILFFILLITLLQLHSQIYLLILREPVDITLRIIPRIHNVSFVYVCMFMCMCNMIIVFIVTIFKYRGTMDTKFLYFFRADPSRSAFLSRRIVFLFLTFLNASLFFSFFPAALIRHLLRYHRLLPVALSAKKLSELKNGFW